MVGDGLTLRPTQQQSTTKSAHSELAKEFKPKKRRYSFMDEDRIGLVLAKTAELRSKIVSSIQKNSNAKDKHEKLGKTHESEAEMNQENGVNDDDEEESLLNIKDALESLEGRLASLQDLQQQQWYERESALSEIELSQKKLLEELKNYRGQKHLHTITEAIHFASSETDESSDLLLLPPYPSPHENNYLSTFSKLPYNGTNKAVLRNTNGRENSPRQPWKGSIIKGLFSTAAKAAFTVVGAIAILSLAGFEPRLKRREKDFGILDLFNLHEHSENGCPRGRVKVIENGEVRCVVKERVEVPFEPFVSAPDVSYGFG